MRGSKRTSATWTPISSPGSESSERRRSRARAGDVESAAKSRSRSRDHGEILCPDLPTRGFYARSGRGSKSGTLRRMSASRELTALVLGAVTRDVEPGGATAPGGVVHYAGLAFAALGARTRVVTRARPEDAEELLAKLRAARVETRAWPSRETTTYANDYSGSEDLHELLADLGPDHPGRSARGLAARRRDPPGAAAPARPRARDGRGAGGPGRHRPAGAGAALLAHRHAAGAEPGAEGLPGASVGREGGRGGDRGPARGPHARPSSGASSGSPSSWSRAGRGALCS